MKKKIALFIYRLTDGISKIFTQKLVGRIIYLVFFSFKKNALKNKF